MSFRHELFRSAVEDSLSPVRRVELHQRVLRVLSELPDADPGRLVHHAWLAGDQEAVLRFGQIAGSAAARQGAHREATRHYRAAAAYAERLPDPEHAELLERYAEEAHLAGSNEEALQARKRALAIRERLGQAERTAENLRWISQLAWWTGRVIEMQDAADRALEVLAGLPPNKELAMAYVAQAQLRFRVNHLAESAAWAGRAVDLAEQLGESEIALHAGVTRDTARLAGGDLSAWASLEEPHQTARDAGLVDPAARALGSLATVVADELARYAEAEELLERSLAYSAEHNFDGLYLPILGARAETPAGTRRLGWRAWRRRDSTGSRGMTGPSAVLALVARGRILAARDEPEALVRPRPGGAGRRRCGRCEHAGPGCRCAVGVLPVAGDADRAQQEARQGLQPCRGGRRPPLWSADSPGGCGGRAVRMTGRHGRRAVSADDRGDWAAAAAEWAARGATYLRIEALAAGDEAAGAEALRLLDGLGAAELPAMSAPSCANAGSPTCLAGPAARPPPMSLV